MIRCANCSAPLDTQAKFCENCGQAVAAAPPPASYCPECGAVWEADARFCGTCGSPAVAVTAAAAPSTAQSPVAVAAPAAAQAPIAATAAPTKAPAPPEPAAHTPPPAVTQAVSSAAARAPRLAEATVGHPLQAPGAIHGERRGRFNLATVGWSAAILAVAAAAVVYWRMPRHRPAAQAPSSAVQSQPLSAPEAVAAPVPPEPTTRTPNSEVATANVPVQPVQQLQSLGHQPATVDSTVSGAESNGGGVTSLPPQTQPAPPPAPTEPQPPLPPPVESQPPPALAESPEPTLTWALAHTAEMQTPQAVEKLFGAPQQATFHNGQLVYLYPEIQITFQNDRLAGIEARPPH